MFDLVKSHSFQLGRDVVIVTNTHEIIDLQNVAMKQLNADSFHIISRSVAVNLAGATKPAAVQMQGLRRRAGLED
jgi:hypothetical protein